VDNFCYFAYRIHLDVSFLLTQILQRDSEQLFFLHIEGIMAEGHINKITDLHETKFLLLFDLTNVRF
jgi:hypothetical protein